ncbi:MAG: M50 family metallopeptidase [Caldisericia bacterium]|nr:M50 family metallopeptidase [Caldisericia bacterium]
MTYLFSFLAINLIIFLHELGHYLAAKRTGMKVERFGIGMGPVIKIGKFKFAFQRGETEYCLCWFPIGGFCQIKGEEEDTAEPDSYNAKPPLFKFMVAFAGPFTNILTTVLVLIILFMVAGDPSYFAQIQELKEGMPAIEAGFQLNDIIVGVNDKNVVEWSQIHTTISNNSDQPIQLIVKRGSEELTIPVTPVLSEGKGIIGVLVNGYPKQLAVGESLVHTFRKMEQFFQQFLLFIGRVFTGNINQSEVGGIISIYKVAEQSAKESISSFFFFIAFLSLNLGVLNLFPFPPLDGGKIIFALLEAILRKKINKKAEIWINLVGFVILIGLMIYVNFLDIKNLILNRL